jgi:hypothetical protein
VATTSAAIAAWSRIASYYVETHEAGGAAE